MLNELIAKKVVNGTIAVLLCAAILTGCTGKGKNNPAGGIQEKNNTVQSGKSAISVDFNSEDLNNNWDSSQAYKITLNGDSIIFDGKGASVKDSSITITSGGTYSIIGTLRDGQILVDANDDKTVRLVLNGADISCLTSAPIYVMNSEKTIITLAEGTKNTIADGVSYTFESQGSDEPNAAIFSKDDLTINGTGDLTVNANYNNGITSKDDLKITSGNIIVNAASDGIRGKNYIGVKDGNITVNSKSDGLQSNNDEDPEKGFIFIGGGILNINAGLDGIQAETSILISNGDLSITSGGGSQNGRSNVNMEAAPRDGGIQEGGNIGAASRGGRVPGGGGMPAAPEDWSQDAGSSDSAGSQSTKGIKAGVDIAIDEGTIRIDSVDDSIHSNDSITVNGGSISIASGEDGIHSDTSLMFNKGDITIEKSYEAIESAAIIINGGNLNVKSSDDGINTSSGNDGSSINGRPGQNKFNAADGSYLHIHGGYIFVDAQGDGLDSNGSIVMDGGVVIVNGPTGSGNGALDYNGGFEMNGGFLVAAGSAGMAQAPSQSSKQNSVKINLANQAAGSLIRIESEKGENILTFAPSKAYQTVVVSSPELKEGSAYTVYTGGTANGTEKDGLYANASYTPGTKAESFKVSGSVTQVGEAQPIGGGQRRVNRNS